MYVSSQKDVNPGSQFFQFIFRFEIGDAYLGAVSRFMSNAFEYGDALLPQPEKSDTEDPSLSPIESNQPYLNLATYVSLVNYTMELANISYQFPYGCSSRRSSGVIF